jgi:hypothetical protein
MSDLFQTTASPVYTPNKVAAVDADAAVPRVPLELFQSVLSNLKNVHEHYEHKPATPPLVAAIVAEDTQKLLNEQANKETMHLLWDKCTEIASKDGVTAAAAGAHGAVQFRHLVRVLLGLRGSCLRASMSNADLIRLLQRPVEHVQTDVAPVRPMTAAPEPAEAVVPDAEAASEEPAAAEGAEGDAGVEAVVASAPGTRPATAAADAEPAASVVKPIDYSSLLNLVDFDDFTDSFCKAVISDAWCYIPPVVAPEPVEEAAPAAEGEAESKDSGATAEVEAPKDAAAAEAEVEVEAEVPETELPMDKALQRRLGVFFSNAASILV